MGASLELCVARGALNAATRGALLDLAGTLVLACRDRKGAPRLKPPLVQARGQPQYRSE
jgi:hypothetical protein